MAKRKDHCYMLITTDKYELPLAVADTVQELANILGENKNNIESCISHNRRGVSKRSKYIKVELEP